MSSYEHTPTVVLTVARQARTPNRMGDCGPLGQM
jgi:hypothetical protein